MNDTPQQPSSHDPTIPPQETEEVPMPFQTASSRWHALTVRDATADSHFVYAVKTTMIYCRPSCSARLARRANVDFYETSHAAAAAGFRACKRCKPEEDDRYDPQGLAIAKACRIIAQGAGAVDADQNGEGDGRSNRVIGLKELAGLVGLTPSYLHKTFKSKMGMTPKTYAESLRRQAQDANAQQTADQATKEPPRAEDLDAFMEENNSHSERSDPPAEVFTNSGGYYGWKDFGSALDSDTTPSLLSGSTTTGADSWNWANTPSPSGEDGDWFINYAGATATIEELQLLLEQNHQTRQNYELDAEMVQDLNHGFDLAQDVSIHADVWNENFPSLRAEMVDPLAAFPDPFHPDALNQIALFPDTFHTSGAFLPLFSG